MQVQEEFVVSEDHMKIMKGKRTKRQRLPSPLRLGMPSTCHSSDNSVATTTSTIEEDQDMANCLILLAQGGHPSKSLTTSIPPGNNESINKSSSSLYLHQCKTCNKCFPSFQALGGHRTSHKKVKPNATVTTTFAKQEDDEKDSYGPTTSTILSLKIPTATTTSTTATIIAKSKVHECSMCGAQFSSGQALGGHMRRHRNFVSTSTATNGGGNMIGPESQEAQKPGNVLKLDLNLPAPEDDVRDSKFSFQPRENVIVFSTSSLVDCHY